MENESILEKHFLFRFLRKILPFFLSATALSSIIMFIFSYNQLNHSIQNERVSALQEIASLISNKISTLKSAYVRETAQLGRMLDNSTIGHIDDLRYMIENDEELLLIAADRTLLTLDGKPIPVDTTHMPVAQSKSEVNSSFINIPGRGRYWIFSIATGDVYIEDVHITGLIKMVSADEYESAATFPLYGGQGLSYVVDINGEIIIQSATVTDTLSWSGDNLFDMLSDEQIDAGKMHALKTAVSNDQYYQLTAKMMDKKWLIQSIPGDPERGIIVLVPISVTARDTYAEMNNVVLSSILFVVSLSTLLLIILMFIFRKNQSMALEQETTKAKNEFLDKMSHDIRTPLNAIIGMNELALQQIDDKTSVINCLKKAKISSDYLISIINDVLDMSRIESGKMTVSNSPFNMTALLDHIYQMEEFPAKEKKLTFCLDVKTPVETDFLGDSIRIRQCLVNLISNAIKFTAEAGFVTLSYEAKQINEEQFMVRFTVQDSGIGMSQDFLQKVFKPFEQEYSSLTSSYVGSGLGLSIVNSLVQLMHGRISVESKLGTGSKFVLELPLTAIPKTENPQMDEAGEEDTPNTDLKGKRILLAEDHLINREIMVMLIRQLEMDVDEAENGQEALAQFVRSPQGFYSMILMDIQMPVMDGLEAAKRIRASCHPDSSSIPIVALSANAFEEDTQKSISAGMQDHLAKPIDLRTLKSMLQKYIIKGEAH